MIRSIFIKAGEIFEKQNLIENSRDIFYLTVDEIFEKTDKNSYKDIIKNRKNEYEVYEQLPAFSRIVFNGKEFNKIHSNVNSVALINNDEETFHGTPCSNGITMGEAIVIKDVKNIEDVKDKIIVAKMTDPGWVFMLALSNGIISEKGSLLSHTAIISRELKIPAIVGVKDACDLIQSGDWLKINGKTGTIEMLRRSGDKSNVRDKAYSR